MVQGEINRGRHTDHPAGRHSIQTYQHPPSPSPHIFYRPDALPAAQPTASTQRTVSMCHYSGILRYFYVCTWIKLSCKWWECLFALLGVPAQHICQGVGVSLVQESGKGDGWRIRGHGVSVIYVHFQGFHGRVCVTLFHVISSLLLSSKYVNRTFVQRFIMCAIFMVALCDRADHYIFAL